MIEHRQLQRAAILARTLHMGNGSHSSHEAFELVKELFQAFEDKSTIEQLTFPSKEERKIAEQLHASLIVTATRIYAALTGHVPTEVKKCTDGTL